MKKIADALKSTPILLALVFIAVCFFPSAIIAPSESSVNAIVTAVGLDKNDQDYEVTLMTFLSRPNQSYSEQYEIISCSAPSISEAFTNASLQIGKNISLFHTHTAVVSEKLLEEEDIASSLDYLARVASIPQSCILISTNVTSKQFLEFVQELDKESDINLEELLFYTSNYVLWKYTTISSFYEGYYSPVKCSLLGHLTISQGDVDGIPIKNTENVVGLGDNKDEKKGNSSSESESQEQSGQNDSVKNGSSQPSVSDETQNNDENNSNNMKQLQIINDGSCILIKNGKYQVELTKEQLQGLNWLNNSTSGSVVTLDNVSDDSFNNAKLIYKVQRKQILDRFEFQNGVPVYTANVKLYLTLMEVNGTKEEILKSKEPIYISETVRQLIEKQVKSEIMNSVEISKTNNCDTLDMFERFYDKKRTETRKLMETENIQPEDFFKNVVFKVIVSIFPV